MTKLKGKVKIKYPKDLLGERFGRLTIVGNPFKKEGSTAIFYQCVCDCGENKILPRVRLIRGETKSCGCLRKDYMKEKETTHGGKGTRIHSIWGNMISRCHNSNVPHFERYGGRGITVCEEWRNSFPAFREWAEISGYDDSLTIDRIDVNGNYEPSNCRWETPLKQSQNRRNTIAIEIGENTFYSISEFARHYGLKDSKVRYRYSKGLRGEDLIYSS